MASDKNEDDVLVRTIDVQPNKEGMLPNQAS